MDTLEDKILVEKAKKKDKKAFEELILKYEKRLYAQALVLTSNQSDAEEVTQETLLIIYKKLHQFRGEAKFYTWASRILINLCHKQRWKRKRWFDVFNTFSEEKEKGQKELIAGWKEKSNNLYLVSKVLEKMDKIYREVLYYLYFENMSYEEIAQVLNCSVGTVKSRIFNGKEKFKSIYNAELLSGDNPLI